MFIVCVIGLGKPALSAKSILMMDILQLHSFLHKVAIDGQVLFLDGGGVGGELSSITPSNMDIGLIV